MTMKQVLFTALLMVTTGSITALAQNTEFKVCKSTYALCTTAKCTLKKHGKDESASCKCDVKTGYSLGAEDCQDVKAPVAGATIKSRYYPIKSFVSCANNDPWAFCLDKSCKIDSNTATATCTCSLTRSAEPYVITTDTYTSDTCTSGIISSAPVKQVFKVTEFLKTSDQLPPFDFKVLNVQNK